MKRLGRCVWFALVGAACVAPSRPPNPHVAHPTMSPGETTRSVVAPSATPVVARPDQDGAPVEGPSRKAFATYMDDAPGPLFVAIDGMCIHMTTILPGGVSGAEAPAAVVVTGTEGGPWGRGGTVHFAKFVGNSLIDDPFPSLTKPAKPGQEPPVARATFVRGIWETADATFFEVDRTGRMVSNADLFRVPNPDHGGAATLFMHPLGANGMNPPLWFHGIGAMPGGGVGGAVEVRTDDDAIVATGLFRFGVPASSPPAKTGFSGQFRALSWLPSGAFGAVRTVGGTSDSAPARVEWIVGPAASAGGPLATFPLAEAPSELLPTRDGSAFLFVVDRQVYRAPATTTGDAKRLAPGPLATLPDRARSCQVGLKGELWCVLGGTLAIVFPDGSVERPALPEAIATAESSATGAPYQGKSLDGVAVGDVWYASASGKVFRQKPSRKDGLATGISFEDVPLPKPPFSRSGAHYRAVRVAVRAAGDAYINAEHGKKGIGWGAPERYRAVLRSVRPAETFRCQEPDRGNNVGAGDGFMSFAPAAMPGCTHPFALLLRGNSRKGLESDAKGLLRALGKTPQMPKAGIHFVAGARNYFGIPVASIEEGEALARAAVAAKFEQRPEILCGVPEGIPVSGP